MEFAEAVSKAVGYLFLVPVLLALIVVVVALTLVYVAGWFVYMFGRGVGFIIGSVIDGVIFPFKRRS